MGVTGGARDEATDAPVFADVLDLMPCAAFEAIVRPSGTAAVTHMNRLATEMFGIELEDARGRPVREAAGVALPDEVFDRMFAELLEGSGYYELETASAPRGGSEMLVRARMRALRVGSSWRLVGTVEDMAPERRLRLRLDVLMALIELAQDPIIALDADRRIVLWNGGAEVHLRLHPRGGPRARFRGAAAHRIPGSPRRRPARRGRERPLGGRSVQTTKDGRRLAMAASLVVLRGESGEMAAVLGVTRHLDRRLAHEAERERARLGERLVRAERLEAWGSSRAGSPTTSTTCSRSSAVTRRSCRANSSASPGRPTRRCIARWSRTSARCRARSIAAATSRASSWPSPARTSSRPSRSRSNAVVTDLQELLQRTLGEHIVLETQLESGIRAIMADPGQLGQVLVNLAVNSRDVMRLRAGVWSSRRRMSSCRPSTRPTSGPARACVCV